MHKAARKAFNESFSVNKYHALLAEIETEFPGSLEFRVAESPVFIPSDLKTRLLIASNSILDQLQSEKLKAEVDLAVPDLYRFPQKETNPHFIALDFGITIDENGKLCPKLIELQGFPSLFAFQHYLGGKYRKHFQLPDGFSPFFNRLNGFSYQESIRKLLKPEAGKHTVLLEAYPGRQKTRIDFELSKRYFDIDVVCLSELEEVNGKPAYQRNGTLQIIDNVYNRVIFDEIDRKYPELAPKVELLKKLDFKWITHPSWYYKISKYTLPFLKGDAIPETVFAGDAQKLKKGLEEYVLKPVFSFAGQGVNLNPNLTDLEKITEPRTHILQEKVTYQPCIEAIDGSLVKTEIRLLYIWPEAVSRPQLVTGLARLSRGEMIGVEHNANRDWVGGSAIFIGTN